VSGGFSFDAPEGEVFESRRVTNGWQVIADNIDYAQATTLTIYAYCSPGITVARPASVQSAVRTLESGRALNRAGDASP
jgi:hypothetical protein